MTSDRFPCGTRKLRKPREDSEHYVVCFPSEVVADLDLEPGERLVQEYDEDTEELITKLP